MAHYIIEQVFGPDEPLPPSRGAPPPGLLISLGDGRALSVDISILGAALTLVDNAPWYEDDLEEVIAVLIQKAQEKPKPAASVENRCGDCSCKIPDGLDICGTCQMDRDMGDHF